MKTRKWLVAVLALAVCLTSLAGCGTKDGNDEIKAGSAVTVNGDKIYPIQCDDTLRIWMGLDPGTAQVVENFGDTPLAKKLEENTGVKVEYIHPNGGNGEEQFQLLLAGDNLPDVVKYNFANYPGGPQAAITDEYIYRLNDLIDKYSPNLKALLKADKDLDRQIKDDNGDYYAYPFGMEEGILQIAYGPIMRKDWLDKVNMEVPETIDEWEAVLTAFKEQCGATAPLTGTWSSVLNIMSAFGGWTNFYLNGDKVVYGPMEDAYKETLAKLHDWYKKGLLDPDIAVIDNKTLYNQMLLGKSGAEFAWAGSGLGQLLTDSNGEGGYDLTGVKFPVLTKGETPEYSSVSGRINMGVAYSISKNCINPELAARFLDYGYSEEGRLLYNFGIEGESYTMVDGKPTYTDLIMHNPDGLSMTAIMGQYMMASYSGPFFQDTGYIEQYYAEPVQKKEAQNYWGETNMRKHLLPQIYVSPQQSDKDADIMTNVNTYREEMTLKFITGEKPLDEFDEYINQIKAYGIDEAIKNRQDAYDRYLKR